MSHNAIQLAWALVHKSQVRAGSRAPPTHSRLLIHRLTHRTEYRKHMKEETKRTPITITIPLVMFPNKANHNHCECHPNTEWDTLLGSTEVQPVEKEYGIESHHQWYWRMTTGEYGHQRWYHQFRGINIVFILQQLTVLLITMLLLVGFFRFKWLMLLEMRWFQFMFWCLIVFRFERSCCCCRLGISINTPPSKVWVLKIYRPKVFTFAWRRGGMHHDVCIVYSV